MFRFESQKPKLASLKIIFPIILIFLLLAGGLIWASSKISGQQVISFQKLTPVNSNASQTNNSDWQKELNVVTNNPSAFDNQSANDSNKQSSAPMDPNNLTDNLAGAALQQVLQGAQTQQDVQNNLNNISQDVLAQDFTNLGLNNLNNLFFTKQIQDSDLNIVSDSQTSKTQYLEKLPLVLSGIVVPGLDISDAIQNYDNSKGQSELGKLINAYDSAASQLQNMATPQSFAEIHKERIELLIATKTGLEKILNYNDDPLGAALALQGLPALAQKSLDLEKQFSSDSYNL